VGGRQAVGARKQYHSNERVTPPGVPPTVSDVQRQGLGVLGIAAAVLLLATGSGLAAPSLTLNAQLYPVGSWPEAAAVGDVTGDGLNDVVMTTSYSNDPTKDFHLFVFAQRADGTLAPPVSYTTSAQYSSRPDSVAVGDITGDGRNDVVVAINGVGIQVFPQTTSGTLGAPTATSTTDSYKIRLGRLNGDDKLDVVGVGWSTGTASVLLNDGNGGLSAPVKYVVTHDGYEDLEVADVTGDGQDDVVVMSGQGNDPNIAVLPQQAGGGFGSPAYYRVPRAPQGNYNLTNGIGVGDVNGDGLNDVVASYGGNAGQVAVFAQTTAGTLATTPVSYPSASFGVPGPLEVADLDQDGRADVVALDESSGGTVGVFRQTTSGTLAPDQLFTTPYGATSNPHELAVGDVTGDGMPDVVYASYDYGLAVLTNGTPPPGSTVPGPPTLDSATPGTASITLKWSAGSTGGSPISSYRIYRGTAPGDETLYTSVGTQQSFVDPSVAAGTTYFYEVTAVNGVGEGQRSNELSASPNPATRPDAPTLYAQPGYNAAFLTWNQPAANGAPIIGYKVYRGGTSGSETFLQQTQGTSFVDSSAAGGTTYFYEVMAINSVGEGPLSTEVSVTPLVPSPPDAPVVEASTPAFGQVALHWSVPASHDGKGISSYTIYRGTVTGGEARLATTTSAAYTDTSGTPGTTYYYEVTATNSVGESPRSNEVAAMPTRPLFQPYQAVSVGSWPQAVAVGDVTGDGRNDVVMTTGYYFDPINDFHLFVFAQKADGTLAAPVSYATAAGYNTTPVSVAVGDITGDGRADVVVGIQGVGIQMFPQTATGTLGSPTLTASADVSEIRLGQLDGDGRLDVASTGNATDVFFNDGHGGFSGPMMVGGAGADLEVADTTNDGRDDLVVLAGFDVSVLPQLVGGGFGSAVTYPTDGNGWGTHGIAVGDITGDGRNDVAVSYGGNRPYSFVTLLTQATDGSLGPPVASPSYDIPEPLDIADLDLDGRGDIVTLHGGWSRAGVYQLQANGVLAPEQLYQIAYASHYLQHGLAIGDVNGDGSPDVVLADSNNGLVVLRNTTAPANVPHAPKLTAAIGGAAGIALTWTTPDSRGGSPSGYRVYRGTSSGGETLLARTGVTTSYVDVTATSGTTYYYRVSAVNSLGEGAMSNERSARIDATAPTKPGGLKLVVAGTSQLALDWSPSTDNVAVSGYDVFRGGVRIATVSGTEYIDSSLTSATTYSYQVRARDAAGNTSLLSGSLNARTAAVSKSSTGTLAGVAYDPTGAPLDHVVVKLTLANGTVRSASTDGSGLWKLDTVPPGTCTLTASLSGHPPLTLTMTATAGTIVLADTTLN
jgi:fibronectin type 3 domain-containing protein